MEVNPTSLHFYLDDDFNHSHKVSFGAGHLDAAKPEEQSCGCLSLVEGITIDPCPQRARGVRKIITVG